MIPLTEAEIDNARRISRSEALKIASESLLRAERERYGDDLAPARGIMVGMLIGSAIWLVLGMVLYFLLEKL